MFMVLFEDTAALIGVIIAVVGIAASETFDRPVLDGAASIGIGLLLGVVAMFLAREAKGLLIGEPAASEVVSSICAIARAYPGVERSNGLFTVHLGPTRSSRRSVSTSGTRSPPPTWRRSLPRSSSASRASILKSSCC